METQFSNKKFILIVDAVIILLCIAGFYQLVVKPGFPTNISNVKEIYPYEISADSIVSINGINVSDAEELEIFLNRMSIEDSVNIKFSFSERKFLFPLISFYSVQELIIITIVGLLFIFSGIFVLLKCFNQTYAHIFHWSCFATAAIMFMSWGSQGQIPEWIGLITHTGYHAAYSFVPASILHFTLLFPKKKIVNRKHLLLVLYSISALFTISLSIRFIFVFIEYSEITAKNYILLLGLARYYIGIIIIIAIGIFVHSYTSAKETSEKKKLLWLMLGFLMGPFAYATLWILPYSVINRPLIPEIFVILLMSSVPITFAISIIKYNLMDIHLLLKRGVVYSIVISSILIIYIIGLAFFASEVMSAEYPTFSIIGVIVVVIIFQPVKMKVQKFVDKKFFRVHYDFRIAIKSFLKEINESNSIEQLASILVTRTNELIPLTKVGFFILKEPENYISLIAHINFDLLVGRSVKFQKGKLKTDLSLPIALPNIVEAGVKVELADVNVFRRWGMSVIFPIKSSSKKVYGFFVLGNKKSETLFNAEDIDLLNNAAANAASTIERIKLQEEVIREHLETERLEELNKMKSYFVSSVSHELKTPLTSIKVFTDLLKGGVTGEDQKSNEYLDIIDGESDRLTRLINNVLNYSKIEKGIKEYNFEKVELNEVINHVHTCMRYVLKINGFDAKISIPEKLQYVYADRDSIIEAVINLISNSIKYSKNEKEITIALKDCENYKWIIVEDRGIGISNEVQAKIFEPFYQADNREKQYADGAGLGLSIVKNIMDAHKGSIEVESELGKGSKFILKFPSEKFNE
ncbi:MAG: HAMP domain-containing histidine kinase [Ignavibacteriae bacterium]|nr:sensor histidine kinase [Ignavibacteriota bacterium]NOG98407.1 HAMP domain-containing histidine kinase [Ignavibacteriota bacterium]